MSRKNTSRFQKRCMGTALLIFLQAIGGIIFSGTAETLFLEGNAFYENGEYVNAEKAYKKILPYGIENPLVYYNLGNACFKQNKIGEAILYYERALRIVPNDGDILDNLVYVNKQIYDKIEIPEESPPLKFLIRLHHFFSLETQLVMILLFLYLLSLTGTYFFLRKRRGKETDFSSISLALLAFLLLLLLLSAGIKIYQTEYVDYGIVLMEKVDVLSGPGETNAILFPMHEGLKVRIREERGEWFQISLPNGLNGWVRKKTIGVV